LTFHHLIPRKLHRRKGFARTYSKEQLNAGLMLCGKCHKGIHKLYTELELGSRFNSAEALLQDPLITRHVAWVARQKS
jgi:hypothetical protein